MTAMQTLHMATGNPYQLVGTVGIIVGVVAPRAMNKYLIGDLRINRAACSSGVPSLVVEMVSELVASAWKVLIKVRCMQHMLT